MIQFVSAQCTVHTCTVHCSAVYICAWYHRWCAIIMCACVCVCIDTFVCMHVHVCVLLHHALRMPFVCMSEVMYQTCILLLLCRYILFYDGYIQVYS